MPGKGITRKQLYLGDRASMEGAEGRLYNYKPA